MNDKLKTMVELYFDGELEKGKEPMLFSMLSQDEEARNYFKRLNAIKINIDYTLEEFPASLDEKILRTVENSVKERKVGFINKKKFDVFVYASAVVFMILSIFFYQKSEEHKIQFNDLTREVKEQNIKIDMLINSLPQIEVQGSFVRVKEVVVRPQS
jgi:hypothetical protein